MTEPLERPDFPAIDDDGLLRIGARWVSIPEAQLPVLRLLLERHGRVVRLDQVAATYARGGYAVSETAIRSLIDRIHRTVSPLGMVLHRVRGRGVMLTMEDSRAEPAVSPPGRRPG